MYQLRGEFQNWSTPLNFDMEIHENSMISKRKPLFPAFILLVSKGIRQLVWTRPSTSTTSSAEALSQKNKIRKVKRTSRCCIQSFCFDLNIAVWLDSLRVDLSWSWAVDVFEPVILHLSLVRPRKQASASVRHHMLQTPAATAQKSVITMFSLSATRHYHVFTIPFFGKGLFDG